MSAEVLRRAAALMRERAEDADETGAWKWRSKEGTVYWPSDTRAGRYVQSWDPAVALAVADWLEECADDYGRGYGTPDAHALTVARAYLGESA